MTLGVDWDVATTALRVGAALIAGAILGINRDLHHKSAGLRTLALVSIGSAVVVIVALIVARGWQPPWAPLAVPGSRPWRSLPWPRRWPC